MIQVHTNRRGKYNNAATGKFMPLHPEKYKGSQVPVFKSTLERLMMAYLDRNESIVSWTYEPKPINYVDRSSYPPKVKRYFVDFQAVVKQGQFMKTVWIEVKPYCETIKPVNQKNKKAVSLWIKNRCKWEAAQKVARSKGYEFHIITEKQLH